MLVRDMIDKDTTDKLYKFTKKLLEDQKDISIIDCMKHDSHKRVNRRIKQRGWGK